MIRCSHAQKKWFPHDPKSPSARHVLPTGAVLRSKDLKVQLARVICGGDLMTSARDDPLAQILKEI